jgi:agmatinase
MRATSPVFADAGESFQSADFVIFGVPFDETSTFRKGSSLGPSKIREASYNFESYILEQEIDLDDVRFHDAGDVECSDDVDEVLKRVGDFSRTVVDSGKTPIAIGGEHSFTPATVACLDDIGVIILDAHLDFRDSYENRSNSHACVTRRVSEIVGTERVLPVGVRSLSREELLDARKLGLNYVSANEILERDLVTLAQNVLDSVGRDRVYLSIDMDVMDPAYAPGVGNPEPFGLSPAQVRDFINLLGGKLVGLDFVEVSPPHDCGMTSLLAARLIREAIAVMQKNQM